MKGQSGNNIKYSAINRKLEDLCAITIKIKYKKSLRQQNISYFGSPKRANHEGQREEGEAKKKGMEILKFCMDSMIFGMDMTWKVRILWFCMEF